MDSFNHRFPAFALPFVRRILTISFLVGATAAASGSSRDNPFAAWESTLTRAAVDPFPRITPFEAVYRFGWEGLGAGIARVSVSIGGDPARRRITASGGPDEWIRRVWDYRADYYGEAGGNGEQPSWFHMDETVWKKSLLSDAFFKPDALLACHRFTTESKSWDSSPLPGVRDLFASMLFVRSLPLRDGDHLRLTVFPDRNPYLVDLTVAGRDTLTVLGKPIRAIRFTIRIRTIELFGEQKGRLAPHKKFHSGRVWLSDDARRLPLRAEVDVFIGSVFCELEKISPPL